MSPREIIRHAAATAKAENRKRLNANCNTSESAMQPCFYTPFPGLVAYVAYSVRISRYEIIVSPISYNDRGLWFEDKLPGTYPTERDAQDALDYLADAEGWRFCTMPV